MDFLPIGVFQFSFPDPFGKQGVIFLPRVSDTIVRPLVTQEFTDRIFLRYRLQITVRVQSEFIIQLLERR